MGDVNFCRLVRRFILSYYITSIIFSFFRVDFFADDVEVESIISSSDEEDSLFDEHDLMAEALDEQNVADVEEDLHDDQHDDLDEPIDESLSEGEFADILEHLGMWFWSPGGDVVDHAGVRAAGTLYTVPYLSIC